MKRQEKRKTVFVGMSGGVDSSVAALLLKRKRFNVVGVFLRCFNVDGCAEKDAEDARRVAEKIKIPFYVFDFEKEYKRKVVEYMVEGYRAGLTPNPDIVCNREIKFGLFLKKAIALGADAIATGHYVKLAKSESRIANRKKPFAISYKLFAARDAQKDQSYFLWTLTQNDLRHSMFPLGSLLKSEVREIARRAGLITAEKKDSQGICFLGKVTLSDFLKNHIPPKTGRVLTVDGKDIGRHEGMHNVTIGQRHIGARLRATGEGKDIKPFYVVRKEAETNTVIVAQGKDNPALQSKEIFIKDIHFISGERPGGMIRCFARVRYRQKLEKATLREEKSGWKLCFETPVHFVAPGQSAVFYIGDPPSPSRRSSGELQMLGGGVIAF